MDFLPAVLSAITAFLATISAGVFVRRFEKHFGALCAFAAGVMLAVVAFEMLPDIASLIPQTSYYFALPFLFGAAGFLSLYLLVSLFQSHKNRNIKNRKKIGFLSTAEFCAHGFLEGLAIGVSFQYQFGLGIVVAAAVIAHDFCDGLSTLTLMLNSGNSVKSSLAMLVIDAVAPILGVLSVLFFTVEEEFLVLAFSFLAGSFIYIGGLNLLPEAREINKPIKTILIFVCGFVMILLLSILIET